MTIRVLAALLAAVVAVCVCAAAPAVATHRPAVSVADPERCC
jgi:hypothetical protein